jgi:hypothetical protein
VIEIRMSDEIYHKSGAGLTRAGHFSFDDYYDPNNMGWGTMRVFNDDWPRPWRDLADRISITARSW